MKKNVEHIWLRSTKYWSYLIKIYRVYVTYSVILPFALTVEERKRPLKRFTPPRKLGDGSETESGSEYSDDDYSESSYT